MEVLKRYLAGEVLEKGLLIHPDNSDEIAWPIVNAKEILEKINLWGLAILGGDIYKKTEQGFKPTYENWHSEYSQVKNGQHLYCEVMKKLRHI